MPNKPVSRPRSRGETDLPEVLRILPSDGFGNNYTVVSTTTACRTWVEAVFGTRDDFDRGMFMSEETTEWTTSATKTVPLDKQGTRRR